MHKIMHKNMQTHKNFERRSVFIPDVLGKRG